MILRTFASQMPPVLLVAGSVLMGCTATSELLQERDPEPVASNVRMELGRDAGCAIDAERNVDCWFGAWGIPENVPSGSYDALSVGAYVACAHQLDGEWVCWGDDYYGIFEDPPDGWSTASVLSVGQRTACALDADGAPTCWGDQALDVASLSPPDVNLTEVVAAMGPSCGVDVDGQLVCWGGWADYSDLAVEAPTTGSFHSLSGRGSHLCALFSDTSVPVCWGFDFSGEVNLVTDQPVAALTAGSGLTTCWINLDGSSQCVGELSDDHSHRVDDSLFWPEEGSAVSIGASAGGQCVLTDADTIECWSGPP